MIRFLALMMMLALIGCQVAPEDGANVPMPVLETPLPRETTISYEVEYHAWVDEAQTEDGIPLASYTCQLPVLSAVREDGTIIQTAETAEEEQALAVVATFNQRFEEWTNTEWLEELAASAEEDLVWRQEEGLEWYGGYTLQIDCTVYQTEHLLSVCGTYYSNTGGAHPNMWKLNWNFDLSEGAFFEIEQLSDSGELQQAVTEEIIRQTELPGEDGTALADIYWEDYRDIAANWFSYAVTFDEQGMWVCFSPYEIAAYAMGPQEFLLSYEWLTPYLSSYGLELLGIHSE